MHQPKRGNKKATSSSIKCQKKHHANLYLYSWKFCGGPSLEENGSSEAKDDPLPPKPDRGID